MIWLFGDSIFRGFALGRFPEAYAPEEIEAEPLWPLRAPASMINLMAGEEITALAGLTGLPDPQMIAMGKKDLQRGIDRGMIKPGDSLVFLDVGFHAADPETHRQQWLEVRRNAVADRPFRAFLCTGFDGLTASHRAKRASRGQDTKLFEHDAAFNRAVVEAACAPGDYKGETFVIDTGQAMSDFDAAAGRVGGSAYLSDGVHLNLWGQLRLSVAIGRAVAPDLKLRPGPVRRLLKQTWPAVQGPTGVADPRSALALVEAAFA